MRIGYHRISTPSQNLDAGIDQLEAAGCDKVFTDVKSGAKANRSGLTEAIRFARKSDSIVVVRLDRLARSLKDLLSIAQTLSDRDIGLISLSEALDTTTSGGKLIFHVLGSIGEFERNLIRERTIAGLEAARARGRVGGRPKALSDSDISAMKAMLADPSLTVAEVSEKLCISPATLYRYLPQGGRSALESQ